VGSAFAAGAGIDEKVQNLADSPFPAEPLAKRKMSLDVIAVAAAVLFLDDVARFGEVHDDAVGGALGDR
jgi:hypothetical protein